MMIFQRGKGKSIRQKNGKVRVERIWWYRFRFGGRIIHESAKTTSKTLARKAEAKRRQELEETYNHIKMKRELPPTIVRASKLWLDKRAALAESTRETYEAALKHVKASLGKRMVCDIDSQDIRSYQIARLKGGAAGATINKEIICLSSILSEYGLWEPLRRDVKNLEENEEAGRALSQKEEVSLLEAASKVGKKQGSWSPIYIVTVLGINTGLRHSEVRKLKWKNINLEKRYLVVGESKSPAGTGRPVPLTQPAWAVLDFWAARFPRRQLEHYVFPACETGQINPESPITNWRTSWRRACTLAGLQGLRYHDCRHTAATKLLEQGTSFAVVAHILGWAPSTAVRMAKRYGHIRPDVQRKALDAVATPDIQGTVHQNGNQPAQVI
jgi:integrase